VLATFSQWQWSAVSQEGYQLTPVIKRGWPCRTLFQAREFLINSWNIFTRELPHREKISFCNTSKELQIEFKNWEACCYFQDLSFIITVRLSTHTLLTIPATYSRWQFLRQSLYVHTHSLVTDRSRFAWCCFVPVSFLLLVIFYVWVYTQKWTVFKLNIEIPPAQPLKRSR
jgi:hypothetical protein